MPAAVCPGCSAPLTGAPSCPSCGLTLAGPTGARLWQVDQRLESLAAERTALAAERERLLAALRSGDPVAVENPFVFATGGVPAADPFAAAGPVQPRRPEAQPQSVQNTLLTLGALLLAIAGIVFAAVTYRHLGPVGRALILLLLTAAAAWAPARLKDRGLTASAEALAAVAIVLGALDAWVLQRAGVADGANGLSYAAGATALLALVTGCYALLVPLQVSRIATVVLAQLPVVLVLVRVEPSLPVVATVLAALGAVDLAVLAERRLPRDARYTAGLFGLTGLVVSVAVSIGAVSEEDAGAGFGLLAVALVLAVASIWVDDLTARAVVSGTAVPLLAVAAWATARDDLTTVQEPLVLAAVAFLAMTTAGLLPMHRRQGPVGGSLLVLGAALVTQGHGLLVAIAGPFTWLVDPWSLEADSARAAISYRDDWPGTVVTLVIVATAAVCIVTAGVLLDEVGAVVVPAGGLVALSALLLPLGQAWSYHVALVVLLVAVATMTAAAPLLRGRERWTLLGSGLGLVAITAAWSTADRNASLTVLPLLALWVAVLAVRVEVAAGVAALLGGAALAAFGADAGLSRVEVSGLLLVAPAVCVGLSYLLRLDRRVSLELASLVLAAVSIGVAASDPGWLSLVLGVNGVLALAVAIRPDRHEIGLLGGLLLSASSWVRLADADVHAPEPYVAPLAITALVFGHLRRRRGRPSSFEAYGAGLGVALVPSLLKAISDDSATRGLLLLLVCTGVVLAGAAWKLRAPLVIGGGVLVVDALNLLGPFARALPRWSLLAMAGAVLVGVGVTYEARRRDLARLRERYELLT
jgi:hypothetical protein